jgi:2-keto-3-deoxy-L-rhamnonate aldolase RhmA
MRSNPQNGHILATAAPNEAFAKEYAALGFNMIFFGTDAHLLQSGLAQRIEAMRKE